MTDIELVTSLEKSKELRDAGFPQGRSYFHWWQDGAEAHKHCEPIFYLAHEQENPGDFIVADAFTIAEILAELPKNIDTSEGMAYLTAQTFCEKLSWGYVTTKYYRMTEFYFNPANLWLWLRKERMR